MQTKNLSCDDIVSSIRIDKLFYYLRFAKSRSIAEKLCEKGHVRLDGNRIKGGHEKIGIGSVITFARGDNVVILHLDAIPVRRGSAKEAQSHYQLLNQA